MLCVLFPRHKQFSSEFAFFTLLENRERIIGMRLGAAQQNISQVILRNFEVIVPASELIDRFSTTAAAIMSTVRNLQIQVRNLSETRDLLLPRLLSGQIKLEI